MEKCVSGVNSQAAARQRIAALRCVCLLCVPVLQSTQILLLVFDNSVCSSVNLTLCQRLNNYFRVKSELCNVVQFEESC